MTNIIQFPKKQINYDIVDRKLELEVIKQNLEAAACNVEENSVIATILEDIIVHMELRANTANDN